MAAQVKRAPAARVKRAPAVQVMRAVALVVLVSGSFEAALGAEPALSGTVTTLAGNGRAGFVDGRGAEAEFMFPAAVAYDRRDGAIYVADSAAQRIRRVAADGSVSTVAGSGLALPSGLEVAGGYADGPATAARFNEPSGIAVGADGSLYVADAFNHCIRRIASGTVSTYAGDPRRPGSDDGSLHVATFTEPRALALGADGALYVADYTVGVRRISPSGVVSTVLPTLLDPAVEGIALWEGAAGAYLFVATPYALLRYDLNTDRVQRVVAATQGPQGIPANGVLALGPQRAVVSSASWADLWSVDFPASWHANEADARLVAGEDEKDWQQNGGFADGSATRARFYDPLSLARDARGNILVADAGNRRIRVVTLGSAPAAADSYRIALAGNVAGNAAAADTLAAQLERRLNLDRARTGPGRPVEVRAVGPGNGGIAAQADYLTRNLDQRAAALVVWSLDTADFHDGPDDPGLSDRGLVAAVIRETGARLRARGIRLVLAVHPLGFEFAPAESSALQLERPTAAGAEAAVEYAALEHFAATLGLPSVTPLGRFVALEREAHEPLFDPAGDALTPAGNELYAGAIADVLQSLKPW